MIRLATLAGLVGLLTFSATSATRAQLIGDTLSAANTFTNPDFTGGVETIFQVASATVVDPGVELTPFATIYDVDFSDDSLTMTVVDNSMLSFTTYGSGTFDRYYYGFENRIITDAVLTSGDDALTNPLGFDIQVRQPGFVLDVPDLFGTGITVPVEFPNGALLVELGEGTDYGTLGVSLSIDLTTIPVPEPASGLIACGLGVLAPRVRRRLG